MARKGKKGIPRRVANQGRVNSRADATPPAALGYPAAQSNRIVETSKRLGKKIYWLIGLLGGLASIWAIWLYFSDQKTKLANVQEQLTIQPEPGSSRRAWNVVLFLINDGPATANEIVCRFSITNATMQFVGDPVLVSSSDAGAKLVGRHDPAYTSAAISRLSAGHGLSIGVRILVPGNLSGEIDQAWQTKMFSREFARRLLANLSCTGENVTTRDAGIYPIPSGSN
jgi:hypothetical protein